MMTLKTAVSVDADNVAEWSKAPALGAGLARGVGSNPTVVTGPDGVKVAPAVSVGNESLEDVGSATTRCPVAAPSAN